MIMRFFIVVIVAAMLVNCSSVAKFRTDDNPDLNLQQTSAKDIKVYSTSDIGREYVIIGQVVASADAGSNSEKSVVHLKKVAAKLGADAIIDLRLEISQGYWQNAIRAEGTAVKFK
ncbi:MAG: hypothetical protein D8M58_00285 [Calditrichaeota bacterium]|nr:MAG: hypothetical protein DWQ03_06795 [Calditrichota bacterium]MBL1203807.1 hypothetical protein [Calditrichota bacterium]NOG43637.1 heavy metal-binding domain-containing protein [Calditrichota bacterium]